MGDENKKEKKIQKLKVINIGREIFQLFFILEELIN
jgi:hypothetical protein